MTKVLITNVYGDDNKGGAAITWATIEAVRRAFPGSTQSLLTISTSGELNQSHRHTRACYPDVPMHPPLVTEGRSRLEDASKFARAGLIHRGFGCVPQVDDADLVVGKGGQLFRQRRNRGGVHGLRSAALPLMRASRRGIPAALYSVSLGPFVKGSPSARLVAQILQGLDLVAVRDARSAEEAAFLGVDPSKLELAPDSVFGWPAHTETRDGTPASSESSRVGVLTAGKRPFDEHLIGALKLAINEAFRSGIVDRVSVVVQTTTDIENARRLVSALDDRRVTVDGADRGPQELMDLYARAQFVVGGRVHSNIFALLGGTPAFPLEPPTLSKARDIFNMLGLGHHVVRTDDPSAGSTLTELILGAAQDGARVRSDILHRVEQARARVRQLDYRLRSLVTTVSLSTEIAA